MTCTLEGVALDESVATVLGEAPGAAYSKDWNSGGPIIARERITLVAHEEFDGNKWSAEVGEFVGYIDEILPFYPYGHGSHRAVGPTALVAAMRALVSSKTPNVVANRPIAAGWCLG